MNNILRQININLTNPHGDTISGDLRMPSNRTDLPLVLIMHGFKGFKDWGFLPYLSEQLSLENAITFCFNFSLNGSMGYDSIVLEMNKFAANTVTRELEDIEFIINVITHSRTISDEL
ncbi:MAG: hypothetical protein WCT77_12925, partial [Bacteroidota bacterium]